MRAVHRDQIVGTLLLAFGVVWTGVVYLTVSPGFGDGIGPRAFPLGLGVLLVFLSALLLISGFRKTRAQAEEAPEDATETDGFTEKGRAELRMVASVFAVIVAYGFLMEKIGFEIATVLTVTASMWLVLGIRKPTVIAAMAIGLAGGCWLVFGKILGAYLPPGTWLPNF